MGSRSARRIRIHPGSYTWEWERLTKGHAKGAGETHGKWKQNNNVKHKISKHANATTYKVLPLQLGLRLLITICTTATYTT